MRRRETCCRASSITLSEPFFIKNSSNWRDYTSVSKPSGALPQQTEYLVDLAPLLCGFVSEALVYQRHDFVEELARSISITLANRGQTVLAVCAIGDFLHKRGRGAPGFIVRCFSDLRWVRQAEQRVRVRPALDSISV